MAPTPITVPNELTWLTCRIVAVRILARKWVEKRMGMRMRMRMSRKLHLIGIKLN